MHLSCTENDDEPSEPPADEWDIHIGTLIEVVLDQEEESAPPQLP